MKVKAMNMIPDPVKAGPASINMTLLVTQDMVAPLIVWIIIVFTCTQNQVKLKFE